MIKETIQRNLEQIVEKIEKAASRSGRPGSDVKLIVVSKAQPVEKMLAAYELGIRYFGENYPEETAGKFDSFTGLSGIEWHMIGHLQSRKAKIVVESFHMLQSLDSLHTAEKLDRLLEDQGRKLACLIEINTGGEESKNGIHYSGDDEFEAVGEFISQLACYKNLVVQGLMTMPPLWEDPERSRAYFIRLRRLLEALRKSFPETAWQHLSMGTSADFETAIEEGSTMVRIGSAILGERVYHGKT